MKIKILLISIILIISCEKEKKEQTNTQITPEIHNGLFVKGTVDLPDNSIILLQEQLIDKSFKTLKNTQIKDKKFSFSELIKEEKLYFIGFNNTDKKIPFIANNFETFIDADINNVDDSTVKGAAIQETYSLYLEDLKKATNKFVFKTNYIKNNSNSILAAIILKQMLGKTKWRIQQNKKAFELLSAKIKNTVIGKEIKQFLIENEKLVEKEVAVAEVSLDPEVSNEVEVKVVEKKPEVITTPYRKKAPNFYAESINGDDISLNSVLKNNKVVLVDFWASWCAPCRAESPKIIRLYNKYHAKGFDVIGVSEDKYADIDKWKNAVSIDGLPWNQVIDDNKRLANMFSVTNIPHTVLLDQNGGIIFAKKSSYTIEQKLKEIFGF